QTQHCAGGAVSEIGDLALPCAAIARLTLGTLSFSVPERIPILVLSISVIIVDGSNEPLCTEVFNHQDRCVGGRRQINSARSLQTLSEFIGEDTIEVGRIEVAGTEMLKHDTNSTRAVITANIQRILKCFTDQNANLAALLA